MALPHLRSEGTVLVIAQEQLIADAPVRSDQNSPSHGVVIFTNIRFPYPNPYPNRPYKTASV